MAEEYLDQLIQIKIEIESKIVGIKKNNEAKIPTISNNNSMAANLTTLPVS